MASFFTFTSMRVVLSLSVYMIHAGLKWLHQEDSTLLMRETSTRFPVTSINDCPALETRLERVGRI